MREQDDLVLRPRNGLSLCAGAGGLDMGLMLAEPGFHTRCFVEWEDYPRQSIIAAQRAGYLTHAPIWDDVTTFDGRPFRGAIDTILAGYPCQPFSAAGQRKGDDDERHLWPDVARIIREVQPRWVFLENVAGHVSLGLETVLRELWDMGWTPAAGLFSAAEVGAPHERLRIFIVAYLADARHSQRGSAGRDQAAAQSGDGMVTEPERRGRGAMADAGIGQFPIEGRGPEGRNGAGSASTGRTMADTSGTGLEGRERGGSPDQWDGQAAHGSVAQRGSPRLFPPGPGDADGWADALAVAPDLAPAAGLGDCLAWAGRLAQALEGPEQAAAQPHVRRMAHGLASRSRALRLLGNGVVPLAAAHAFRSLATAHGLWPVDLETARAGGDRDARQSVWELKQ